MTKEDITRNPYISCVEAYYLAWLAEFTDIRKLYVNSFAEADRVLRDFSCGASYADYGGIARVQDEGERLGVTAHILKDKLGVLGDGLNLIRVNKSFFKGLLVPWRADHYIAVLQSENGEYGYINHYPLESGTMSREIMLSVYGGGMLTYVYLGEWRESLYAACKSETLDKIKSRASFAAMPALTPEALRDAIGILRISRQRIHMWLSSEGCDARLLQEQISDLQKSYFTISADLQRGKVKSDYGELINDILEKESLWRKNV